MGTNNIDARKHRWVAAQEAMGDRQHLFLINYLPDNCISPSPWPEKRVERMDAALQAYERELARSAWLQDDTIPCLNFTTGTEIFAEAFGCPVHRPDDNMPYARPLISSATEVAKIKVPELSTSSLAYLFESMDALRQRAGNEAVVRMIDLQSPMDVTALIWDKNDFYIALIEEPEAVHELADKVTALMMAFLDEWFARYGNEFIAHYPNYYMPYGVTLSVDEIGVISEGQFIEYFKPEISALANRYGRIGIHSCAHARHQWGQLLAIPQLRVLNLVQPEPVIREAWAYFAPHLLQMHSAGAENGPAWSWRAQYPEQSRMVIQATAATREEALELSERLQGVCGW